MTESFKEGDRVRSVYLRYEPENIGTVKISDGQYCIVYDNEPDEEYLIVDDNYLKLYEAKTEEIKDEENN